jgi:hypothetical protein
MDADRTQVVGKVRHIQVMFTFVLIPLVAKPNVSLGLMIFLSVFRIQASLTTNIQYVAISL